MACKEEEEEEAEEEEEEEEEKQVVVVANENQPPRSSSSLSLTKTNLLVTNRKIIFITQNLFHREQIEAPLTKNCFFTEFTLDHPV